MKIRLLITITIWAACSLQASTPPANFIIELMAKSCLASKTRFKGIMTQGDKYYLLSLNKGTDLTVNQPSPISTSLKLGILDELMNCSSKNRLLEYLRTIHVDTNIVSLGFFANEPVYIIGARALNNAAAQLWINKSSLLPVKEHSGEQEILFEKWQLLADQKSKFPHLITKTISQMPTVLSIAEVD